MTTSADTDIDGLDMSLPPRQAGVEAPASRRRWIIAFILFLAVLSAFFDRISVAVLFTNTDFQNAMGTGFNPTLLGLLMTSFVFAYGCSGLLLSFVGDLYGLRRSLAIGTAFWGVFMALMAGAGSFTTMLSLRILLGIAEGPQFAITNSVVKRWFPRREQARANSIWMIGSPLGSAIGFPLMIYLETTFGWRSAFMFLAVLNGLIILPLVLMFLRDHPPGASPLTTAPTETEARPSYLSQVGLYCRDWRFWILVVFNSAALDQPLFVPAILHDVPWRSRRGRPLGQDRPSRHHLPRGPVLGRGRDVRGVGGVGRPDRGPPHCCQCLLLGLGAAAIVRTVAPDPAGARRRIRGRRLQRHRKHCRRAFTGRDRGADRAHRIVRCRPHGAGRRHDSGIGHDDPAGQALLMQP
jgi:Major Facilitator Superfamily